MASVCGGSLAMMDAGVPIKAPVAGVAMGLIMDEATGKYAVLSDIAGAEDHYGDMDFKVAGTANGITALQMDIKVSGVSARDHARGADARPRPAACTSSSKMQESLSTHRANMSAYAPRIITIKIPVDKIRDVIGPGGKMIRSIIEKTGVKIDVEDDGHVNVASADEAAANKAIGMIQELTATAELNKTYLGKVQRITDFGAFVEIMAGTDGLLHVSEIAHYRVKDVRDELKEGQQVLVKVINIDPTGKIRLSRKALITPEEGGAPPAGNGGEGEGAPAGAPSAATAAIGLAAIAIAARAVTAARAANNDDPDGMHVPSGICLPSGRSVPSGFLYNQVMRRLLLACLRVRAAHAAQEPAQNRREFTIVAKDHVFTPNKLEVSQDDLVKITLRSEDVPVSFAIDAYRIVKRVRGQDVDHVRVPRRSAGHVPLLLQPHDRCRMQGHDAAPCRFAPSSQARRSEPQPASVTYAGTCPGCR